jgi:DNA-binding transcriptional MocR family regulator
VKTRPESTERPTLRKEPFAMVPEWVLDLPVSDRAIRLYAVLGRYTNRAGQCWPSRETLARRLRCSPSSVDRAVKELVDAGALRVRQRGSTSNIWTVVSTPRHGRQSSLVIGDTATSSPVTNKREPVNETQRNENQASGGVSSRDVSSVDSKVVDAREGEHWDAVAIREEARDDDAALLEGVTP